VVDTFHIRKLIWLHKNDPEAHLDTRLHINGSAYGTLELYGFASDELRPFREVKPSKDDRHNTDEDSQHIIQSNEKDGNKHNEDADSDVHIEYVFINKKTTKEKKKRGEKRHRAVGP
jgi:hypothetical protein